MKFLKTMLFIFEEIIRFAVRLLLVIGTIVMTLLDMLIIAPLNLILYPFISYKTRFLASLFMCIKNIEKIFGHLDPVDLTESKGDTDEEA